MLHHIYGIHHKILSDTPASHSPCDSDPAKRLGLWTLPSDASQVGLKLLVDDPGVFKCYDRIRHIDLSASLAILNAGFSLDSHMTRRRGVNRRDRSFWACNAGCEYKFQGCTLSYSVPTFKFHNLSLLAVCRGPGGEGGLADTDEHVRPRGHQSKTCH